MNPRCTIASCSLLPPQQVSGKSYLGRHFFLLRKASWWQEYLGQVTYSQLTVPPGHPQTSIQPFIDRKYHNVLPRWDVPLNNLSSDNLAVSSWKVGTKPVPRVPLGTSSSRSNPHLHTVPKSSGAWVPSPQQAKNSKIKRGREPSRTRQTDIRRSDRWQVSSKDRDRKTI